MKTMQRIDLKLAFVMATVLAVIFCGAAAHAQSTWSGTIDDKWGTAGNWNFAPANGSNLVFSGTSNQINTNNAGITSINNLILSNGGWDIKLGGSDFTIAGITATNSSSLTGNVIMTGGDRTITLSGSSSTLTLAGTLKLLRTSSQTLTVNGAGNTLVLGGLILTDGTARSRTIAGTSHVVINGSVANGGSNAGTLIKTSTGSLTLNGTNTYTGNTTINAGTLALGASASINTTPRITIAAGATFDVSSQSAYTLSTNLTANGSNTVATVKGAVGGTVSLGGKTVTLNWRGGSSGVVSDRPPLTIADAELVLNDDPLVVNVLGEALGEGVYTLISTSGAGSISGTVNSTPVYGGNGKDPALPANTKEVVSISGNSVILTIAVPPSGTVIIIR
jgi:fibronectin-binding autotransporter adhesin